MGKVAPPFGGLSLFQVQGAPSLNSTAVDTVKGVLVGVIVKPAEAHGQAPSQI